VASDVVLYAIAHQPRRLKLPAQPVPPGAAPEDIERCLFDEAMNERYFRKVAERCYWPATELFAELADQGVKLSLGLSLSWVRQARTWDPDLLARVRRLIAHSNVELVGADPYHSFLMLLDAERFVARMRWMRQRLGEVLGCVPAVADTTEMVMSATIYRALDGAGFDAALMDGRPWVMGWREPSFLYHGGGRARLLTRHPRLSDDVGYRFSDRRWSGWPLLADTYADWLRAAPGDVVVLGWDYETFGEHHAAATGIFDFMRRLPVAARERGVRFLAASEAVEVHRVHSHALSLPVFPTTWAGSGGMDFFLGNLAQQAVFQLMLHAYNTARLTGDERLVDLAEWLAQSDNLHLIQWFGRSGAEAEVSAYFTPREWWSLGADRIVSEIQEVYKNFVRALGAPRPPPGRRFSVLEPLEPEVAALTRPLASGGGRRRRAR
jgi:alpha-amylase